MDELQAGVRRTPLAPPHVDGFPLPVPRDQMVACRKVARKEHGALDYVECVADDVLHGRLKAFPRDVKPGEDEVVLLSFIVYKSREHRDSVNAQVAADPRIAKMDQDLALRHEADHGERVRALVDI